MQEEQYDTTTKEVNGIDNILEEVSAEANNDNHNVPKEISTGKNNANEISDNQVVIIIFINFNFG